MAIDALVKPFLSLPLFRGLKPLQLTEIVRRADRIVYRPGEALIHEDEAGDAAVVIISGEAVRMKSDAAAERVLAGALVGELAMLIETVHSATVIAKTPVRALRLSRSELHALMREDPALADHFSMRIAARLKRLSFELKSIDDALAAFTEIEPSQTRDTTHAPITLYH